MTRRTNQGRLAELASLPSLDRCKLLEKWQKLYGSPPPTGISRSLLVRAIAYRMQEQILGGIKPATSRILEKIATAPVQQISAPTVSVKPGTRLLREWHSNTYEVVILERGVQCNGKQYRSLSEVAHAITGTRRSGPLFFGLKKAVA